VNYKPTTHISEIFTSIQGEGTRIGQPSHFIRFSGCNLCCVWCDTPVNPPAYDLDIVVEYLHGSPYDIVFTGGEPMLYQSEIIDIIEAAKLAYSTKMTIETNGTIPPNEIFSSSIYGSMIMKNVLWSVSPKLKNSAMKQEKRWNEHAYTFFTENAVNLQLKFVVSSYDDIDEILNYLENVSYHVPIILQPCCQPWYKDCYDRYIDDMKMAINMSYALTEKKYRNVRVLPQLHKIIWGFKSEGV